MNPFDDKMDNFDGRMVVVKSLVGSHNYNLNTPSSDRDYKLFVEPSFDDLYAGKHFATGAQSNTVDYTVHDVRGLSNLLWKANINFIEVLFSVDLYYHAGLSWIFNSAEALARMNLQYLYKSAMGMHYDKMKNLHKGTGTTSALVEKFGYDTKQATHALRLLYVVERIASGLTVKDALYFPNKTVKRNILLAIKSGKVSEENFSKIVSVWRKRNLKSVDEWFSKQEERPELKEKTDNIIKDFIKMSVRSMK